MAVETTYDAAALAADIEQLVRYAVRCGLLHPCDAVWAHNAVLEAVGAKGPAAPDAQVFLAAAYATSPTSHLDADSPVAAAPGAADFDLEGVIERIAAAGVARHPNESAPAAARPASPRQIPLSIAITPLLRGATLSPLITDTNQGRESLRSFSRFYRHVLIATFFSPRFYRHAFIAPCFSPRAGRRARAAERATCAAGDGSRG